MDMAQGGMTEDQLQAHRRARLRDWLRDHGGQAQVLRDRSLKATYGAFLSNVLGGYSFGSRAARTCEERLGMPPLHLDKRWPDDIDSPQDHLLILDGRTVDPKPLAWETLIQMSDLPATFALEMPDDAMAPATPRGTVLYMRATSTVPPPGTGVLVKDSGGRRFVRRVREAPGGAWLAAAHQPDYVTLHALDDGLTVLAEVTGRKVISGAI